MIFNLIYGSEIYIRYKGYSTYQSVWNIVGGCGELKMAIYSSLLLSSNNRLCFFPPWIWAFSETCFDQRNAAVMLLYNFQSWALRDMQLSLSCWERSFFEHRHQAMRSPSQIQKPCGEDPRYLSWQPHVC